MRNIADDVYIEQISLITGSGPTPADDQKEDGPFRFLVETNKTALNVFGKTDEDAEYCYISTDNDGDDRATYSENMFYHQKPKNSDYGWVVSGLYSRVLNGPHGRAEFDGSIYLTKPDDHEAKKAEMELIYKTETSSLLSREASYHIGTLMNMFPSLSSEDRLKISTLHRDFSAMMLRDLATNEAVKSP